MTYDQTNYRDAWSSLIHHLHYPYYTTEKYNVSDMIQIAIEYNTKMYPLAPATLGAAQSSATKHNAHLHIHIYAQPSTRCTVQHRAHE
jgi:hypothetical protein